MLFDLPPVLNFADALAFSPLVDGIVVVIDAGRTTQEDLAQTLEMFREFNVLGFVLNKVTRTKAEASDADYYRADALKKSKKNLWILNHV